LGQKRSDQKRQLAKNGLKIKVVEPAEGYLAVFTVLQETPWLLRKTQNKFPEPAINNGKVDVHAWELSINCCYNVD
jgi:hypothetical protein